MQRCADWLTGLEQADKWFLRETKLVLREGIRVFEQLEGQTIATGSQQLLEAVRALPKLLEAYYTHTHKTLRV